MRELLAKHPMQPAEITRNTVAISKTHSLILPDHAPQTGLEAKFSMEFAMGAAVIARRASLGEYTDAFVRRPEVQELMRKVAVTTNENYDLEVSGASVWDQVTVELVERRAHRERQGAPRSRSRRTAAGGNRIVRQVPSLLRRRARPHLAVRPTAPVGDDLRAGTDGNRIRQAAPDRCR
jgi:2-methylcitrate dehydratase PrpD